MKSTFFIERVFLQVHEGQIALAVNQRLIAEESLGSMSQSAQLMVNVNNFRRLSSTCHLISATNVSVKQLTNVPRKFVTLSSKNGRGTS